MIQCFLTVPAEHFHGEDWCAVFLREPAQHGECRVDVKSIVVLFAKINKILLEQHREPLIGRHGLSRCSVDDLPFMEWRCQAVLRGGGMQAGKIGAGCREEQNCEVQNMRAASERLDHGPSLT